MAKVDTKDILKQGADIAEQMEELYEKRDANRKLLRMFRDTDQLTEAEEEQLEALYPPRRERTGEEEDFEENGE